MLTFSLQMKGKEQISVEVEASKGSGQEGMPSCPRALQMANFTPLPNFLLL